MERIYIVVERELVANAKSPQTWQLVSLHVAPWAGIPEKAYLESVTLSNVLFHSNVLPNISAFWAEVPGAIFSSIQELFGETPAYLVLLSQFSIIQLPSTNQTSSALDRGSLWRSLHLE